MINLPFFKKGLLRELPEKIFEAESLDVRDFIAPSSIEIRQSFFKIGEKLAKSFFVFSYPRYLTTGWFAPIVNLESPLDIAFFIHPIDTALIMKQLRKKVTEVQAELMEREEKGLIRDPVLETAFQDLEALRDGLQTAQEKMFRFGLYLTVYADSEKQLRDLELTLRSILEGRLIFVKPAFFQQKEGFISSSPYGLDLLQVHTPMNTGPLSSAFPFVSFDLSSNEGILYGVNRHNNSLILFDRFSLENANLTVFAKSGAGKSLRGSESVLVRRGDKTQLTAIGPLVEELIKKRGTIQIEKEIEGTLNPGVEVFGFDKNLQGKWSRVTVAARKKAPPEFYKFTTRSGREVTTTGDHNLVVLREGRLVVAKSAEINKGEFVPLPREVLATPNPIRYLNLLDRLKRSEKVYIAGAQNLIQKNYKTIKAFWKNNNLGRYLYRYGNGRLMPIRSFLEILESLSIAPDEALAKTVRITSRTGKSSWPALLPVTPALLKILGYIASEGTFTKNFILISNLDPDFLIDLNRSLKEVGALFYHTKQGVVIAERPFVKLLKELGAAGRSKEKKVCPLVFDCRKESVAQYLSAYFEGDGGVEASSITAVSKSDELISGLAYLLSFFGITGRITKTRKRAINAGWRNKKTYYKLTISGQDNLQKFSRDINFISRRKRKKLSKIIGKNGNTNVDVIPGLAPVFKEIYRLFGCQLHNIQDISNISRGHYNPSPDKLRELIGLIENRVNHFKNAAFTYKTLSQLPELATIIKLGKNDKDLNRTLWQRLGQSWRVVKNEGVKPRLINAFEMIRVVSGQSFSLPEVKRMIYSGFQEMDLMVKYYDPSLQTALVERSQSNTSYEMIREAARYVWQNLQQILSAKIPLVEEKLTQLKTLAEANLFWDPVVKIEKIKNKRDSSVYDLMVDDGVFLAGRGGVFVHNSYFCKLEILRSLMAGIDVIIIDPENEYKFLADSVGGSFINISLGSENHVNPFDLPLPREDEKPEDVLRSNIINLVGLLRLMLGGLTPEEDAIMDRALAETYAAKDITPETDPAKWPENIPLMSDLQQVLETMEGGDSLVRRLEKFTRGTFSQFFNQPSNISLDKNLVVFGIRDMEDELRPMAMFVVMRYVWNKIRSQLKRRMLLIDEAWWLMQSDDGASFLFGMAKRARKYWLGVTTITQDVGDFLKSDYGVPIVANSSLQLLLKQSPAVIDQVQKAFNLTEEEKLLLLEAGIGEGVFIAGQKHVAIRVVASYAEDQIITTSPEQMLKIKKARQEGLE
jgi:intein/homing endonuclease